MQKLLVSVACATLVAGMSGGVAAEPLKAVIAKALTSNPEVLGARANRKATEQELEQAKAPRLPTVDLRATAGREYSDSSSLARKTGLDRTENSIIARQMLFDGGAVAGEIQRQTARLESLDARVFDVSDSVGQRIADVYVEVLKATELYRLAKENVAIHHEYLNKLRERSKAGVSQRADLQLAEGREALASSTLTNREAQLEDAKIRYRRLVGEMPRDLVLPEAVTRAIPPLLELATEVAYANNASLKVAKAEVVAAREAETVARARHYPTLSLEAGATLNRNLDGTMGKNNDQTLMLVANYNLFRGGADDAKILESGARLTAAMESENNVRRTIEEETGRAWVALNAAKASLGFLKDHMARSEEVKAAYQAQFDIGRRTMIDLMNAENELFQARSSLTSGLFSLTQSEYRLLAVMGGLLKILGVEAK